MLSDDERGDGTNQKWKNISFTFRFERRQAATDIDQYPRDCKKHD